MKPIDLEGFDRLFRTSGDPWNYRTSAFEAKKRDVLLKACGAQTAGRVLEIACANGETSRALLPHSLRLLAVDGSPAALEEARSMTADSPRIQYRYAILPQNTPRGPFDLIVVSEIAYYLSARALTILTKTLAKALASGGRLVALHHVVPFDDATCLPAMAHRQMRRDLSRCLTRAYEKKCGRYEAVAFTKPLGRRGTPSRLKGAAR